MMIPFSVLGIALMQSDISSVKLPLAVGLNLRGEPTAVGGTKAKAAVLLFVSVDCPIANRYTPEMTRIVNDFSAKGVDFYRVYPALQKSIPEVIKHGQEYKLSFPALLDPKLSIAAAVGATVTPEAVVLLPNGRIAYRGRIDQRTIEHGKERPNYRRDLRLALNQVLAGKKVEIPRTAAIGCFIASPE